MGHPFDDSDDPARRGWAPDEAGVTARQSLADELVGRRLTSVRYITLDYSDGRRRPGALVAADDPEWTVAPWRCHGFHQIEHGIELSLDDGGGFFITWDSPGSTESLRVSRGRLAELLTGSGTAVWDVSGEPPWAAALGNPLESIDLVYEPWNDEGGFWCSNVLIVMAGIELHIDLSDADADGRRIPSADNLGLSWRPVAVRNDVESTTPD